MGVVLGLVVSKGSSGSGGMVAGSSCGRQTEGNSPSSPGMKMTTQTQLNPVVVMDWCLMIIIICLPGTSGHGLKSGRTKGMSGPDVGWGKGKIGS